MSTSKTINSIAVIGTGSWGGTLAWLLATAGRSVVVYTSDQTKAAAINNSHSIATPKLITFPASVRAYTDLAACVSAADSLLLCCTSQSMRLVIGELARLFKGEKASSVDPGNNFKEKVLISAVKGLELSTYKRMSQVVEELLPENPFCSLSGPNLADEILAGLPSATVVGSKSAVTAEMVQQFMTLPAFRVYCNEDLIGVELGGTLKNVIALAAGASDGLNLGSNAKAALLTRGLAEMTRFAVRLGAKPQTLAGLSGMGDLIATCSGPSSRNYRLGMELAKGRSMQQILDELNVAVEGVPTTKAVCELSRTMGVELPIVEQVNLAIEGRVTVREAIMNLMTRRLSVE